MSWAKRKKRKKGGIKKGSAFLKESNHMNSNINLNSNTQKKLCTSMNATKETYGSLIKICKAF
jgi:hypothetical protein